MLRQSQDKQPQSVDKLCHGPSDMHTQASSASSVSSSVSPKGNWKQNSKQNSKRNSILRGRSRICFGVANTSVANTRQAEHTGHGFAGHGFAGPSDMDMDMHTKTQGKEYTYDTQDVAPPWTCWALPCHALGIQYTTFYRPVLGPRYSSC